MISESGSESRCLKHRGIAWALCLGKTPSNYSNGAAGSPISNLNNGYCFILTLFRLNHNSLSH